MEDTTEGVAEDVNHDTSRASFPQRDGRIGEKGILELERRKIHMKLDQRDRVDHQIAHVSISHAHDRNRE